MLIIVGIIFFVLGLCLNRNRESGKYRVAILCGGIAAYLYFVLVITILGRPSEGMHEARLIPLWSWYQAIFGSSHWYYFKEIILNVLLFMPIGFLAGAIWKIKAWQAFLSGVILSLVIELIQFASCRGYFEWDDILHNALGFLLGALVVNAIWKKVNTEQD